MILPVAVLREALVGHDPHIFLAGPLLGLPVFCLISRSSSFDLPYAAGIFQPAKF